jgi:hypothetical protein
MKPNIKVITSSPEGFWINSTLIQGERDAILIDAQFTMSDARRLANAITESKKNLVGQSKTVEADVRGEHPVKTGSP